MNNIGFSTTLPDQNDILSYLYPETVRRGIVVTYKVGSGKTYAAAALAHMYLEEGFHVIYLSYTVNSINNFRNEYDIFTLDQRIKNRNKSIHTYSFIKFISDNIDEIYTEKSGLIIIDEAHNLREIASRYIQINDKLQKLVNMKVLVITATPMIDSPEELQSLRTLGTSLNSPYLNLTGTLSQNHVNVNYIGTQTEFGTLFYSEMEGIQAYNYSQHKFSRAVTKSIIIREISICASPTFDKNTPLKEQSSKLYSILEEIKKVECPKVIYSFFIKHGINFVKQALKEYGYREYTGGLCFYPAKRFAVIVGTNKEHTTKSILNTFNSINNEKGELIELLIGSNVMSESISLKKVRQVHVLTPFWNYGQIDQAIGRATRINSHEGLSPEESYVNVYLHTAYCKGLKSIDEDMWSISWSKKQMINKKISEVGQSVVPSNNIKLEYPTPDNNMIIKVKNWVWDLRACFDSSPQKISWCKIDSSKAIGYNIKTNNVIKGHIPDYIHVFDTSKVVGHYIWKSCVDHKFRYSYIDSSTKNKKKRGKIFNNMNNNEIYNLALTLKCTPTPSSIFSCLKSQKRVINKQIHYE